MHNIIKTFVISLGMVFVCNLAQAQFNMTDQEKEEALEAYLEFQDELDLTDAQQEQVKTINTTYFEGLAQLKNTDQRRLEKYKTFKKLSSARDSEMKKVLDERQFKLYQEFQKENRGKIKNKRKNRS